MDKSLEDKSVQNFIVLIRDIITDVLSQSNLNIEKCYDGLITSVDSTNNTATVQSGYYTFENLPNKTGETLAVKDAVRIKATTKTLSDAYIGVKLN